MAFFEDLTGTLLDRRYQITGLLGKGGMGHVYAAEHVALEQKVAIKVLHPRYAAEERFRERFIREARSASKIQHRNVVRITDFGDTPDGSVYFVMERLEGHDVGEELRRTGAMPWPRTRHILLQAVGALRAAHAKDIIHRDIKPANCFLTVDGEDGVVDFVKLLDFGIAKVGSDSHADAHGKGLTGTGEVFGTASYMSPEQARGRELDARSDMYSLGIMAYEMLTGQVPFTGVNSIHVITRHLSEEPVPPRKHAPSIPAEVEALVLKMIEKEAARRYETMGALEHALRSIPESAGEPGRRTRIWGGVGSAPVRRAVASGTLGGTNPSARAGGGAGAGKTTGRTGERTAVVSPRGAVAGAAGGGLKGVGAARAGGVASGAAAAARPVSAREASVWPPDAPPRGRTMPAIAKRRDRSVPPPPGAAPAAGGAVAAGGHGSRDRSVPPPGAVTQVVAGQHDRSVPPGAVTQVVAGQHDRSVPPGAVAQVVPGQHDRSVPPGAVAQVVPGQHDRSVPPGAVAQVVPVGHDHSVPLGVGQRPGSLPGAWSSGASSTGPLTRVGDSSAETSPQSMSAGVASPAITGRMVAVVLGLVIVVGAGSAVGTMAFLSSREAVEPVATRSAMEASEPGVPAQGVTVVEGKEPVVPEPTQMVLPDSAENEAAAIHEATNPAQAADEEVVVDAEVEGTSSLAAGAGRDAESAPFGSAPVPSESDTSDVIVLLDDAQDGEPEESTKAPETSTVDEGSRAPKRPKHETAECAKVRKDAAAAVDSRAWPRLGELTRKTWCWSEADKLQRKRWHVRSYAERHLHAECVKAGGSSEDPDIKRMVAACKKRLAK